MKKSAVMLFMMIGLLYPAMEGQSATIKTGRGSLQFRTIGGVSMRGYGAMNIGVSHPNTFKTMACPGGPWIWPTSSSILNRICM